jgi:hypothetical protein
MLVLLAMTPGAAAGPVSETWTEPEDFTFVDQGCDGPATIHLTGIYRLHLKAGAGAFLLHVTPVLWNTWTEQSGEVFSGPVNGPVNLVESASGTFIWSEVFNVAAHGDGGRSALFRYRAHLTVTPDGDVTAMFERIAGRCT